MAYPQSFWWMPIKDLRDNVKVPNFQRALNPGRVEELVKHYALQKRLHGCILPLNVLIIARLRGDFFIVDGQHRREAILRMQEPPLILVQTIEVESEKTLFDLFRMANDTCPVELYTLELDPKDVRRTVLNLLTAHLYDQYKSYITKAGKKSPQFPHIWMEQFHAIVHLIPGYAHWTPETVVTEFEKFNLGCKARLSQTQISKSQSKSILHPLYISLAIKELYLKHHS